MPSELQGFTMYLLRAVAENVPLNLEIVARKYSPEELFFYICGIRGFIDHVYDKIVNVEQRNEQTKK